MITYSALPLKSVQARAVLARPGFQPPSHALHTDPALALLTDFRQTRALTVLTSTPIDEALAGMIHSGVRLLLVVNEESELMGMITADDIKGEKPLIHLQSSKCTFNVCSRDEVFVCDIMEPVSKWLVVHYSGLRSAKLSDVVATFNAVGRRHLIVVETDQVGETIIVRGLFSATEFERALGISISAVHPATSFAEIEQALAH